MDALFEAFKDEITYYYGIPFPEPEYKTNSDEFNVVDGEEADNGIIKYFSPCGEVLLAVKNVYGGDNEDIQFTKAGKEYLGELYISTLKQRIKEMPTYEE